MNERITYTSGTRWEDKVGYSRAVCVANRLEVSGTVATDASGDVVGKGDYYRQTVFILQKIEGVLEEAGFNMADVIRTRMFVLDIGQWQEVGKGHRQFFSNVKPATSMVEVNALIDPECLVEIEITALKTVLGPS